MKPSVRHVVLFAVEQVNARSKANGKTYLQKLCYFVQRLTNWPLGFRAHYYGPYSDQVSEELSFLTGAGFLDEARRGSGVAGASGWEIARFDYKLTTQGQEALDQLARRNPAETAAIRKAVKQVLGAGDQSYIDLSFAAKTDWILQSENSQMTFDGIAKAATRFNWNVKGTDVKKASAFLSKLGLVTVK
jgi:uncharacterized protein YwgA